MLKGLPKLPKFRRTSRTARTLGRLGEVQSYGPARTATFYIGMDRGEKGPNFTGDCAVLPAKLKLKQVDEAVRAERVAQLGSEKLFSATRTQARGVFEGKPENSVVYTIVDMGLDKNYPTFRQRMNALAEGVGKRLCQDSVIVVHHDGERPTTCGAVWYDKPGEGHSC
jgi:hypothetical protein